MHVCCFLVQVSLLKVFYSDVKPVIVNTIDTAAVYAAALEAANAMPRWELLEEDQGSSSSSSGDSNSSRSFQAVSTTKVMRFKDDIVVRVTLVNGKVVVDTRSRSRIGQVGARCLDPGGVRLLQLRQQLETYRQPALLSTCTEQTALCAFGSSGCDVMCCYEYFMFSWNVQQPQCPIKITKRFACMHCGKLRCSTKVPTQCCCITKWFCSSTALASVTLCRGIHQSVPTMLPGLSRVSTVTQHTLPSSHALQPMLQAGGQQRINPSQDCVYMAYLSQQLSAAMLHCCTCCRETWGQMAAGFCSTSRNSVHCWHRGS